MTGLQLGDESGSDSANNDDSDLSELDERIPLMDEYVRVVYERNLKKTIADAIEPEDESPFARDLTELGKRQKEIYDEKGSLSMGEYTNAFPEPPEGCSEYEKAAINAAGIKNIPGHDTVDITLPDRVDDVIFLPDDLEFLSPTVSDSSEAKESENSEELTLSDLSGYGPTKVDRLNEIGINSVEDYMDASVETLTSVKGISENSLEKNDHPMSHSETEESEESSPDEGDEGGQTEETDGETDYLQMVIESDTESLTDLTEEKIAALR